MVSSSSSNLLIACLTNSLSWPLPSNSFEFQISLWNCPFFTFSDCQFLSIALVISISFIFGFSSFNHWILSTTSSPSSSYRSSCSIFASFLFSNYFFIKLWSSISHLTWSGVGSIFFIAFSFGLNKIFSSNDSRAYLGSVALGLGKDIRKFSAKFDFSFWSYFFCCYIV